MNSEVSWDKNEKTIGVLGLSPFATLDFCSKFFNRSLQKEWLYPRMLMDMHTKIPSRGRFFELGETDPVPYIKDAIKKLHEHGADFIVIPCNTVHILYNRFADTGGGGYSYSKYHRYYGKYDHENEFITPISIVY
jgi:aspartate racemase